MTQPSGKGEIEMSHPKSGQTCHADKTEQNHEGEKALHTTELQNYNHDNDSKQEENTMALRADLLNADLRIVEGQERPAASDYEKIFEKAAERAINLMTLDERIESFRRWPFAGVLQDFKDLLKMQYERDTEDYSNPGTWYGVIRKWQAMTEEEALAAFRTDWNGSYSYNQYTQVELKALYDFVKDRPLPPLSEQEKLDYYDRRIEPACLKKLFKEMDEADLVHIFENTYDYNHAATWTVCEDDFEPFRNAMVRPDVLESLLCASSAVVVQPLKSNVIPFTQDVKKSTIAAIDGKVEAITQTFPPEEDSNAYENEPLYVRIAKAISHPKNYQLRYDHLKRMGKESTDYGIWLKNLVGEYYYQDYSQPATEWGVVQKIKAMSLSDFRKAVNQLSVKRSHSETDIESLYDKIQNLESSEAHRQNFYVSLGMEGILHNFLYDLPSQEDGILSAYRDSIAPFWTELSHPGCAGDDGIKGMVAEILDFPSDILMLLSQELPKHQRNNAELLPSEKQINSELLEELRAMDPEERAEVIDYIKQMED